MLDRRTLLPFLCLVVCVSALAEAPPTAQSTRAAFLKVIDRPPVPLSPHEDQSTDADLTLIKFTYASDATNEVPGILLRSPAANSRRRPAVIAAHGTGGKKEDELPLLRLLAHKGFIAVAIDARYHGQR
jgi:dipeptidyl aminopeptidase/acylaminoacyl peptidase